MTAPTENEPRKLAVGMLLLGGLLGKSGEKLDTIWTVKSVGKRSAHVVYHSGGITCEATLNVAAVPPGWQVLDNRQIVELITQRPSEDS